MRPVRILDAESCEVEFVSLRGVGGTVAFTFDAPLPAGVTPLWEVCTGTARTPCTPALTFAPSAVAPAPTLALDAGRTVATAALSEATTAGLAVGTYAHRFTLFDAAGQCVGRPLFGPWRHEAAR